MPPKVVFFFTYRRRIGGKPFNFGSCPKEGVYLANTCFFFSFILKKKSLIIFFSIVQGQGLFDSCFLLSLVCL